MKKEVQWFAYLGIQKGFLTRRICIVLKNQLGDDVDLLAFGEKILEDKICEDFELIQDLVDEADEKAEGGSTPPEDPFSLKSKITPNPVPAEPAKKAPTLKDAVATKTPSQTTPPVQAEPEPFVEKPKPTISHKSAVAAQTPPPAQETPPPAQAAPVVDDSLQALVQQAVQSVSPQARQPANLQQAAPAQGGNYTQQPVQQGAPQGNYAPPPASATPAKPAEPKLSDELPSYSMKVASGWPDFKSISKLPEKEVRQALIQILMECQRVGASDLHLSADARPFIRLNRRVKYISDHVLTEKDSQKLNSALLSEQQNYNFEKTNDFDYALALDETNRFRVNLMVHKEGPSGTYRIVPSKIKSLEELGFTNADTIKKLLAYHNGLILVTGPVGAGKTVTLAALVDELNKNREDHLITVEAPIEIIQKSNQCQITQREVGPHTKTFHSALKGALRQDPDIIVIGEMRDLETIEMAISASETGHLVIGTMHTQDAATTLNRLLDVFPAAQQTQIRAMVSESLKGIVCQRLLPTSQGGITLANELLLNNTAVASLIRENKTEGLANVMETGISEGMVLMDKSVMQLWRDKVIDDDVAIANLTNKMLINQIKGPATGTMNTGGGIKTAAQPEKKKGFFRR